MPTIPTLLSLLSLVSGSAFAGSISAPGVIAGPDSGAATPNPAALHYNPAAMGGSEGVDAMADVQVALIRVDVTSTRNDGIDPNTGEPYALATARVQVPVAFLGATWKVIPDRLALGLGVTDSIVGGGDYRSGEPESAPPYQSHQRYAGVMTKLITLHLIPGAAVTVVDGLHVGGSARIILDSLSVIQASDPLGTEGLGADGPYSNDTLLQGDLSGMHLGWSAGLYFDKVPQARIGASFTSNGTFHTEGEGSVSVPDAFGGGSPAANITFTAPLPPVVQLWVNSDLSDKVTVGAGAEIQLWGMCCGDADGDIVIGLLSEDGDAVGADPEDGVALTVAETQYSPRRLHNSANLAANVGWQANDRFWLGGRLGYNGSAVPDFAVSATNLDFQNVGAQVAGRVKVVGPLQLGLSYAKFFTFPREITNSAWDVRDSSDPDYVDDHFSPKLPYKAGTNGRYVSRVDIVGVRLAADF